MANVQKENGFVPIARELLSALLRSGVPRTHLAVMFAVMDKTYGWSKKSDRISTKQIAKFTDLQDRHVRRTLNDLEEWNMIRRSPPKGKSVRVISVQKDFDEWHYATPKTRSHRPPTPSLDRPPAPGLNLPQASPHAPLDRPPTPSLDRPPTPSTYTKKHSLSNVGADAPPVSRTRSPPESWALKLSDILIECLQDVPGARFPRGCRNSWARQIERMPREIPELRVLLADERSARIEFGIRWALGRENLGHDYGVVIRCGKSLREKWPKLVAASQRRSKKAMKVDSFRQYVETGEETVG